MTECKCGREMICLDPWRHTEYCPDCCVINGKRKTQCEDAEPNPNCFCPRCRDYKDALQRSGE